ncbi:MAG: hypothetical protein SAL07_19765 [Oscillatoria sp. PMC 1051.18]|uniref:hypothetical protein n=1 Tax=Oscillatoria salina TaxID=331517 RepID=UPI0013BC694C|nr:hypothetical protein [Oscillatoria salina]MBZ8180754.1 hypothetical protein [Oscillatoria salina IIICB1]MEC4895490.1 hypothetical protein [Oscillatoria sp. PMC 1050.18]MEC5032141.1 hypothetical protein [Oscillatoria sp. PMC 1051.18]NET88260.1 hypothetical protein [Kamptonema sp. SIO1D9]
MDRKINRHLAFFTICATLGIVFGGVSSQAQINQCVVEPTEECVTKDPLVKQLEGMSFGLIAGLTAGFGATWKMWFKED